MPNVTKEKKVPLKKRKEINDEEEPKSHRYYFDKIKPNREKMNELEYFASMRNQFRYL